MMMKLSVFFGLTVAAGLTAAATLSVPRGSPSACSSAFNGILSSPDPALQCLSPSGFNDIVTQASQKASEGLTLAIDSWLTDIDVTIAQVQPDITAGCGENFDQFQLPFTTSIKTAYPVIREIMCLKDTSKDHFCMTEIFNTTDLADLQVVDPVVLMQRLIAKALRPDCNQCAVAAFKLYNSVFSEVTGNDILQNACGGDFPSIVKINSPINVTQTAKGVPFVAATVNTTGNSTSGSVTDGKDKGSGAALGVPTVAALLLTLSAVFTFL
ncbi:hypothetical protein DFH09DRAFT_1079860 [Mycena vulgaris]|nr:hypothetical protein DFH09DRAFT_1079860 [Mycena vulgaris]